MTSISIPWGDAPLSAPLPADWTVQQVAEAAIPPAAANWPDRLAGALAQPEGTPPLGKMLQARRTGRVVLVVEDMTRHSPLEPILRAIGRELQHARVPAENVELVFATGMHPPMTAEQAQQKLGPLAGELRWRSNPWAKADSYVHVGDAVVGRRRLEVRIDRAVAGADLRILVSSVSPHLQAGFGGGYKMLVPGCASVETIRHLHLASLPRRDGPLVGQPVEANLMRRYIDAAGQRIDAAGGATFSLQYVLDAQDTPSTIAAGDVATCQRMMAKSCAAGCGVVLDSPADVVVTHAAPRDFDLWQSFKAVAHACGAARPNGVVICVTRCPGGVNMPTMQLPVGPAALRRIVRLLGADALAALMIRLVPRLAGDAAFFVRLALRALQRNVIYMVCPRLAAEGARFPGMPILPDLDAAIAAANAHLPAGPKRVVVFPNGGISYPILRRSARPS